ncbi:MAG: hypothetical protein ACRD0K_24715 [Egibacteraceae bacterium]
MRTLRPGQPRVAFRLPRADLTDRHVGGQPPLRCHADAVLIGSCSTAATAVRGQARPAMIPCHPIYGTGRVACRGSGRSRRTARMCAAVTAMLRGSVGEWQQHVPRDAGRPDDRAPTARIP